MITKEQLAEAYALNLRLIQMQTEAAWLLLPRHIPHRPDGPLTPGRRNQ